MLTSNYIPVKSVKMNIFFFFFFFFGGGGGSHGGRMGYPACSSYVRKIHPKWKLSNIGFITMHGLYEGCIVPH